MPSHSALNFQTTPIGQYPEQVIPSPVEVENAAPIFPAQVLYSAHVLLLVSQSFKVQPLKPHYAETPEKIVEIPIVPSLMNLQSIEEIGVTLQTEIEI